MQLYTSKIERVGGAHMKTIDDEGKNLKVYWITL